jgi:carnitine 3-dehydrogenase
MAQFGPALAWPWSKLTDVPELTDELLDKIVGQSDAQAGGRSVRQLERLRDDCLVSVLQALRAHDFGAGEVLNEYERRLFEARVPPGGVDLGEPLRLHETTVPPDWIDYNGHVHESRFLQVFGDATDALLRLVGIDADYLGSGSYYTVETHLSHLRPAFAGDRLHVTTQVLGHDDKRLHVFHSLRRDEEDDPLATAEQMLLHVDTKAGRAAPARPDVLARVEEVAHAHAALPLPDRAGRRIAPTAR